MIIIARRGSDDSRSTFGRVPALARRPFFRKLLRPVQAHPRLVLGDFLDYGGPVFMAVCSMAVCRHPDPAFTGSAGFDGLRDVVLVLVLGSDVGTRRAHLRVDHA